MSRRPESRGARVQLGRWAATGWVLRWLLFVALSLGGLARSQGADPDFFGTNRLHEIRVTLPAAEWEALRSEHPDFAAQMGSARTNGRPARVYRDHRGTVEFDGQILADVAVRKRGFIGSVLRTRPSLNFDFNAYVPGRRVAGLTKLSAANNRQDPTAVQQSLVYWIFRRAGLAAPRTALARVTVNDEPLGVYTLVEPVDRAFVRREFPPGDGGLWEGTLTDFRPEWLRMFEAKAGTAESEGSVLAEVARALEPAAGAGSLEALGRHVDLDRFLTFWALEVLVNHGDGYANNLNNYFVHEAAPDGKLVFVPWGADQCFAGGGMFVPAGAPSSVRATSRLARRMYEDPVWRERYRARMGSLLTNVWDEPAILAELGRLDRLVGTNAWSGSGGRAGTLNRIRGFVRERKARLGAELARPAKAWTAPERDRTHLEQWGTVTADFDTAYRRQWPLNWFTNGTVDLAVDLDGVRQPFVQAGVAVGPGFDVNQTNEVWLTVLAMRGLGRMQVPAVGVRRSEFVAGRTVPVTFFEGNAFLFAGLPDGGGPGMGFLEGTVRLDEAEVAEGGRVRGRLEAVVWRWRF